MGYGFLALALAASELFTEKSLVPVTTVDCEKRAAVVAPETVARDLRVQPCRWVDIGWA
jgi:hypothetical protein